MPKPYPPEFRQRALYLVTSGRTVTFRDVTASLGIADSCLYSWKSRDLIDRDPKPGITPSESSESRYRARRKLVPAKTENTWDYQRRSDGLVEYAGLLTWVDQSAEAPYKRSRSAPITLVAEARPIPRLTR